jgi:predicted nucleic acid-binding protein
MREILLLVDERRGRQDAIAARITVTGLPGVVAAEARIESPNRPLLDRGTHRNRLVAGCGE